VFHVTSATPEIQTASTGGAYDQTCCIHAGKQATGIRAKYSDALHWVITCRLLLHRILRAGNRLVTLTICHYSTNFYIMHGCYLLGITYVILSVGYACLPGALLQVFINCVRRGCRTSDNAREVRGCTTRVSRPCSGLPQHAHLVCSLTAE
jgi:hypothetical protein